MGGVFPKVVSTSKRKLHCDCERIQNNYNSVLNEPANRHQLFKKLNDLDDIAKMITRAEFKLHMNRWDNELMEYTKAAEKNATSLNITRWTTARDGLVVEEKMVDGVGKEISNGESTRSATSDLQLQKV